MHHCNFILKPFWRIAARPGQVTRTGNCSPWQWALLNEDIVVKGLITSFLWLSFPLSYSQGLQRVVFSRFRKIHCFRLSLVLTPSFNEGLTLLQLDRLKKLCLYSLLLYHNTEILQVWEKMQCGILSHFFRMSSLQITFAEHFRIFSNSNAHKTQYI